MNSSSPPKETVINFSKDLTESPVSSHPSPSHLSRIPESPAPDTYDGQLTYNENVRRSSSEEEEIVVCDPPDEIQPIPETPSRKSQVSGKGTSEIDDDDPFLEELDLPEAYKKMKFSCLSNIQLVSLIIICAALVCSLTINILRNEKLFGLYLWKWELMVLVLLSGRLVSGWAIRIVVFFIERNFLLRKRVLYFVYGLRNAVKNCVWLTLVFIAWQCILKVRVEKVVNSDIMLLVTKIWGCSLVGTLLWLLKTLLVKFLAVSFHVTTFFDRIQETLFYQYVIETLSGPASMSTGSKKKEQNRITIDHLHRLNRKNISAWNMKRLMKIVRKGALSTLDEKIQGSTSKDEAMVNITNENQAKAAAKKIFFNVAKPGSKYLHLEDLMRFMREDEALKTIRLFEDGISKRALQNWVVNAFRERKALVLSLKDTKTAIKKLHHMLNVLVVILIIVMWLIILKIAPKHFFIYLGSQFLLVVFMFGNTCKTIFEAIIFLFVMHPFDVGDRVEVDGVQMIVEEMNILTTVFLKFDNHKIYYPNSVLATKPISNYHRSPDMGDEINFSIHISTPGEKIALMKETITRYVDNRSDHWYPAPMIVMRDVEDMNRLKFSVWLSHKMNFQDMDQRWTRRALLVEEMLTTFRELDIEYRMLPLDVNIRNMPRQF